MWTLTQSTGSIILGDLSDVTVFHFDSNFVTDELEVLILIIKSKVESQLHQLIGSCLNVNLWHIKETIFSFELNRGLSFICIVVFDEHHLHWLVLGVCEHRINGKRRGLIINLNLIAVVQDC